MSDTVSNIQPSKTTTEPEKANKLRLHRIEMFMEVTIPGIEEDPVRAFTRKEAERLAAATETDLVKDKKDPKKEKRYERPLHVSSVRKLLDMGCHPKMVVRILGD